MGIPGFIKFWLTVMGLRHSQEESSAEFTPDEQSVDSVPYGLGSGSVPFA